MSVAPLVIGYGRRKNLRRLVSVGIRYVVPTNRRYGQTLSVSIRARRMQFTVLRRGYRQRPRDCRRVPTPSNNVRQMTGPPAMAAPTANYQLKDMRAK